jgi:1-acyl-sn-glycerol-3-phosphate acyltransferase
MKTFNRLAFQPYKWLVFLPGFIILSTFIFLGIIISGTIAGRANPITNKYLPFLWAYLSLKLTGCKVVVEGKENIDKETPYVFVMNHSSNLDALVSCLVFKEITWVMKSSLRKIPVFGKTVEVAGSIFVDRSNPELARNSVINAKERIKKQKLSIVFCPEGTRSADGKLQPFKKGAFVMAEDLDVPVVPISIKGAFEALPSGGFDLFPHTIVAKIHKPIDPCFGSAKLLDESYKIIESDLNG